MASKETSSQRNTVAEIRQWLKGKGINSTADVKVPKKMMDQVIGQKEGVKVAKKAAEQRRHLLLIGDPGTGKSMIASSMTEFLPPEELEDILVYPNPEDPNEPRIRTIPGGKGRDIIKAQKAQAQIRKEKKNSWKFLIIGAIMVITVVYFLYEKDIMILVIGSMIAIGIYFFSRFISMSKKEDELIPKLLTGHERNSKAPFIDATGAHSGALLGDVKHDPFQSGGLETPPHERVEVGAIHKAHRGVLFIDEINLLRPESQQALLTAMQEKKFSIFGQSERSAGAMVKTEPVPCDFILVAAGNLDSVYGRQGPDGERYGGMHPALRSRIRGYGYEVYVNTTMKDTERNRFKVVRFIAQEIRKDGKIGHFDNGAIAEVIREAQRRAGVRGQLSLRFRELGGLVRAAGDLSRELGHKFVTAKDVQAGKVLSRSLEQQVVDHQLKKRKEYSAVTTKGFMVGMVNGLAVMQGDQSMSEMSGIVTRVAAEVTPASSKEEGRIIATGSLGEIAKESVQNVSALIKKITGKDISDYDLHIQFVDTHGVEGDSASISIATAIISALEDVPVDMTLAMTGSLSVRGEVLPVGGVTAKIEAAAKVGLQRVLIPRSNLKDVILEDKYEGKIEVIPVSTFKEVLKYALMADIKKETLFTRLSTLFRDGDGLKLGKKGPQAA
ncbi:MAG: ATP-dependent protease LonB [Candidatus Thermoplasmatota archaeon]|nr:ATP-dependent protease LonB [Candidatus Thermoplasmatota archaeon]